MRYLSSMMLAFVLVAGILTVPAGPSMATPDPTGAGTFTYGSSAASAAKGPTDLAAEARQKALASGAKSNPSTSRAGAAAAVPPNEPRGRDVQDCLSSADANDASGRVYNRMLWCQRHVAEAIRWSGGPGSSSKIGHMRIYFTMVAYGRDDHRRNTKIFFKVDKLESDMPGGLIRKDLMFYQRIGCEGQLGCLTSADWESKPLNEWEGRWASWFVHSDSRASNAPHQVLRHKWFTEGKVEGWDGKPTASCCAG